MQQQQHVSTQHAVQQACPLVAASDTALSDQLYSLLMMNLK